jgi:hypothetical protein
MNTLPKWYLPVAIAALLWNLMGCAAYLSDVLLTAEDVAKMTAGQQALYASRPAWAVAGTAIAVWGGALGSLGLILRRRWALPLLSASVIGLVVQDVAMFVLGDVVKVYGSTVLGLQLVVLAIAVGLLWFARVANARGWLR